jgi:hypothetical protein
MIELFKMWRLYKGHEFSRSSRQSHLPSFNPFLTFFVAGVIPFNPLELLTSSDGMLLLSELLDIFN